MVSVFFASKRQLSLFSYFYWMTEPAGYDEKYNLARVAAGDETAFRELYFHWEPMLSGYIYRITSSIELSEEIVQDVFTKIWMTRETLTEIRSFKHYLFVISKNHALTALKKTIRERKNLADFQKDHLHVIDGADSLLDEKRLSLIDEAINTLSERRKEVFIMNRKERMSYKQIATQLQISTESVKTHLKLAKKSITAYLKEKDILTLLAFFIFLKK
ncbi:MAG TPA: sigma-70 family RNA polymerase sigma factor [Puia sp.]|nr:sigma-70 family RNA polymerase sigma factor [Puia sp.]